MRVDHVVRLELGTVIRPPEEIGTGGPTVDAVLTRGTNARGVVLLDTGLGETDEKTVAWYRPKRAGIEAGRLA